jgi:Asp-tRNA(Asn)/Glu-tRNA(Gln) amidotransferase C subunit
VSYLTGSAGGALTPEQLELLCRLLDLPLLEQDAAALAGALRDQLASLDQVERLPLDDVEPALGFDPRWGPDDG